MYFLFSFAVISSFFFYYNAYAAHNVVFKACQHVLYFLFKRIVDIILLNCAHTHIYYLIHLFFVSLNII